MAIYADLLKKWNPKINLVSGPTLDEIWHRHILDSAQIYRHLPHDTASLVDFGSGGGFPGMVLAILAGRSKPDIKITLVDSDQRKCAFLRNVARETATSVEVAAARIADLPAFNASVVTARALAPLTSLIGFADHHLAEGGIAFFLKGQQAENELAEARVRWFFDVEALPSVTDSGGSILKVENINAR